MKFLVFFSYVKIPIKPFSFRHYLKIFQMKFLNRKTFTEQNLLSSKILKNTANI